MGLQPPGRCPVLEPTPPLVLEAPHRAPLGRQHHVLVAVVVEIAQSHTRNQPHRLKGRAQRRIIPKTSVLVAIDPRRSRLWIATRQVPTPREKIEVAVAVEVAQGQRPDAR